ncbi:VOC family protein [Dietzia natronolimnaea]|uniref:VOC family protein n=1 Tax=Dietzia natronolimnaea TaxID=161920 RepID=A0A2A2WN05_9ACTN|nr:VOC family protein [Dietzia natronolimnaea]PAY22587.1 VOC family protein [Dietzia natronolimnaea]
MAMTCVPYISFPGNAAEAFPYYQELFGGTLEVMTYDQFPSTEDFPFDPPHGSVAHATLEAPGITLTGGDAMGETLPQPRNDVYSFLLGFDTEDEARAFLDKVTGSGGEMAMPFEVAPWGDLYGQVHDRFGIRWDVVVEGEAG